ncbi:hypothetical protein A0256_00385 [Mucilaginibacter sp. PAMC 26640]|nr:hypothetical protein A0256_00385 [Mucilaginibacter sp. PAMC 26640]
MVYSFAQQILLRRPVKSPADYLADPQSFLDDIFFRAAIRVATPVFYANLEKQHFLTESLSPKEANTLQKYINRYCFRPTPFGLFSSISLVEWTAKAETQRSVPKFKADIRPAMTVQHLLGKHLLDNELNKDAEYEANPSIYRILDEYRFFRTSPDETGRQRDFQLQSIAFSKVLKDLLTISDTGCTRQKIVEQIMRSAECTTAEAEDYAVFLIDSQLMVNCRRLPITGKDHLITLTAALDDGPAKTSLLNLKTDQRNAAIDPSAIALLEQNINALLPENVSTNDKLSIILTQDAIGEGPDINCQEKIRDGIAALACLTTTLQPATISQFIKSFQQHFEGQTLPLLQALDPEAGIGYQLPETEKNNPLLETLHIPYRSQPREGGTWSAAHGILMECWLRDKSNVPVINLLDTDLHRLKSMADPEQMLGMSVLFRVAENKVFIENAGGINAPALLGRFTVADKKIAGAARSMARYLEDLNPEAIFAELLHLADPHTDNVNRREHLYHYEMPITAASTLPEAQQVRLSDLYLRIVDHQVILFSEKHRKIVIPRLTSAYNHGLNKLPLFRFLADLSYQYGRSGLGLDLRQLFPNLHFYPRVEYKDSILSLANWIISENRLSDLQQNDQNQVTNAFNKLKDTIRLPRYFSLTEGDQELIFDSESRRDIEFFCACIRQKKEVVIKEYLVQPAVQQYNAYLLPDRPLVLPKLAFERRSTIKTQRKYVPGSEWLYLKIYAPKIGINRLLLRLRPLLNRRYGEDRIRQWFFIRYEDHAPHIRLRLKLNPGIFNDVLLAFKTKLEDRIQQHVIREFQIDVYSRELERYVAGGIENTEAFFGASSELVLNYLKQAKIKPVLSTHAFALYTTQEIIKQFISDLDGQMNFTWNSFQQFLPEFSDKPFKIELDKKYRELSSGIMAAFQQDDHTLYSGSKKAASAFIKSLRNLKGYMGNNTNLDYLRGIIHMHLNRIFTDESRKQEMICNYLLHKYLLSVKGRNKRST